MSFKNIYYRTAKNIQNRLTYPAFLYKNVNQNIIDVLLKPTSSNAVKFHGEPRNHNYSVHEKKLYPSFKLFERWNAVEQVIPKNANSLLDMACCRGFYVLQSVLQNNIKRAVGVDIDEEYLRDSEHARSLMQADGVSFHMKTLDNVITDYEQWGGKFDVVLLTGAYHYFFWGSRRSDHAYHNHDVIMSRLATLCQDTLIISARFEVDRLPYKLHKEAIKSEDAKLYTVEHFMKSAEKWFTITQQGMLGEYPLYVLKRKNTAAIEKLVTKKQSDESKGGSRQKPKLVARQALT